MRASRFLVMIVALGALTLAVGTCDANAQKKKKAVTPPPAAAPQKAPAQLTVPVKSGTTLREVLLRFKGELTTIGVLKQVEADHFVVEEDGVETIYPFDIIHSVKKLKVEEESEDEPSPQVEIKLQ